MDLDERSSRHDLVNKEVRDGVLRVLKSKNFKPSEHKVVLKPQENTQSDYNLSNKEKQNQGIPVEKIFPEKTQYTLHIPHIERAEFAKRFKVVEEEAGYKKEHESKQEIIKSELVKNYRQTRGHDPDLNYEAKNVVTKASRHAYNFLEIGKVLATAGAIFLVLFTGLNFSAFKQIAGKWLNPDDFVEKQIALESALDENEMPKPDLLPTAGMKRENRKSFPDLNIKVAPIDNRIIIPKIGKNIPIVAIPNKSLLTENWKQLEKDIQEGLRNGVVHYPGTAVPGQNGNFFVTGHSSYYPWDDGKFKDIFALLHDVEVGDEYSVYWNQKKYDYRVREKKVVSPKDTSALDQPKDEKISTLMTCTPVGTAKNRLILISEQIE